MCSSWYMLRYPDARNSEEAFNSEYINQMLPVDKYVGGAEHSCMHLIYARYVTKVLRDAGYLNFDEPFKSLVHQGTILGPDGQKMSKSKGNTISPDEYIDKYGSDVFRTYLMFGFNYIEGGPWSDSGVASIKKYYDKVEGIYNRYFEIENFDETYEKPEMDLMIKMNNTIERVTSGLDAFQFNTSVARMMEMFTAIKSYMEAGRTSKVLVNVMDTITKLMAPEAPHLAEFYWEKLGHTGTIFKTEWPVVNTDILKHESVEIPVQLNSKKVTVITVDKDSSEETVRAKAMEHINAILKGRKVIKVIFVANRIINFIAK